MTRVFTAVEALRPRLAGTDPEGVCPNNRLMGQSPFGDSPSICPNNRFWDSPRSGTVPPTSRSSGHGLGQVFVASARQADQDRLFVELERFGKRMGGLEGRDDAFGLGEPAEGGHGFVVGRVHVLRPPGVAQERMLRAHARVVEA